MLIDRYSKEDIFARVPKRTQRIDPVLQQLDAQVPGILGDHLNDMQEFSPIVPVTRSPKGPQKLVGNGG